MAKILEARAVITGQDRTGAAFSRVAGKLDMLNAKMKAVARSQRAVGMVGGGAFATMAKFVTAGAIYEGVKMAATRYMALEKTMTELGITAGATNAEIAAATDLLSRQGPKLGFTGQQMGEAANSMVAAGMGFKEAVAGASDVAEVAKAENADLLEAAAAGNAVMQSLGVTVDQLGVAFDKMATGSKFGAFEFKNMAREFPKVAASAQKLGFQGVDGVERMTAMLEIARKVTGDGSEAATNLEDAFHKVYSPRVQKNFKKMGIDINKVMGDARKNGENAFEAIIRSIQKLTKGKTAEQANTIVGKLFGDKESLSAVQAMLSHWPEYEEFLKGIHAAQGTVAHDLSRVMNTTSAKWDQAMASFDRVMVIAGKNLAPVISDIAADALSIAENFDRVKASIDNALPSAQSFLEKMGLSKEAADTFLKMIGPATGHGDFNKDRAAAAMPRMPGETQTDAEARRRYMPSVAAEAASYVEKFFAETQRLASRMSAAPAPTARPTVAPAAPVAGKAAAAGAPVFGGRDAAIDAAIAAALAKRDQYRGLASGAAQQALMSGVIRRAVQEQKAYEYRRSAEEYADQARDFGLERAARGPRAPRDRMSEGPAAPVDVTGKVTLDPNSKVQVTVRIQVDGPGKVIGMSADASGSTRANVGVSMPGARGRAPRDRLD